MRKKVWLITHDGYIDRRIFFFADVFKEKGWDVKLFPFFYFELDTDIDPFYVKRPIVKECIKKYRYNLDNYDVEDGEFVREIIEKQNQYFGVHGKYADGLKQLGIKLKSFRHFKITNYGDSYSIIVKKEEWELVYFSRVNSFQLVKEHECIEYERAIFNAYKAGQLKKVGDYTVYDGIQVRCSLNEWGEKVFEAHKSGLPFSYEYDASEKELNRYNIIDFKYYSKDIIQDLEFDFIDFKQTLFEYTCVFERVKQELEIEKPDFVYVADLPTLPIGVMLKKTVGCDLMVDCHEWWFQQTKLWEGHLPEKVELAEKYEKLLYQDCDICVTVGKLLARDMSNYYQKNFYTIYSCMSKGLVMNVGGKEPLFWNQKFGIPEESRIAIFQGGMTTLRNLDNLARATKYLKDRQFLVIVGDGGYRQEFEKILHEEGSSEKVLFTGWIRQTELNQYSANADVGVIPYHALSDYYAYSVPNKLMEYCETQTPILYDKNMREIGNVVCSKGNGVGVSADLSNPEEFGNTLAEMLGNDELLKNIKESYRGSENEFSYEAQKASLMMILEEYFNLEEI